MTRLVQILIFLLALAVSGLTQAQDISTRRIGVQWRNHVPLISFSVRDLATPAIREKLMRGTRQLIATRVYAYRGSGDRTISVTQITCDVVYDVWEEAFRVQLQTPTFDRTERLQTMEQVLDRCLVMRELPLGTREDWAGTSGRTTYFAVISEFNPISRETVERIRRWIARPSGSARIDGDAFFGSFVSVFINRNIGGAERTVRFRSPPATVP